MCLVVSIPAILPSWRAHGRQLEINVEQAVEWAVIAGLGNLGGDANNNARGCD
jgi:hypothetical protein